jgi:hypothetical protein
MEQIGKPKFIVENFLLINLIWGTIDLAILSFYFSMSLFDRLRIVGDQFYEYVTLGGFTFAFFVACAATKKSEITKGFLALCAATIALLVYFWGVEIQIIEVVSTPMSYNHRHDYIVGLLPIFLLMAWHGLFWQAFESSTVDQEIADMATKAETE